MAKQNCRTKINITILISIVIIIVALILFFLHNSHFTDNKSNIQSIKVAVKVKKTAEISDGFRVSIPKLNVEAPVTANVDAADKIAYDQALENGVVQMKGSGLPGGKSNIFIFGHSSFYKNQPGNYKEIFATLNQLQKNDQILIDYNQKEFIYIVVKTEIVDPNDVAIANPTKNEQLTLMTCWPPNTADKRYVIIATPKK